MITFEALYQFLKDHYKAERFHLREGDVWGHDYSQVVTQGSLDSLNANGFAFISKYESATGNAIKFDENLNIVPCA
jgi:hypothetical protein